MEIALYGDPDTVLQNGLAQTAAYATHCGADEAHLIIFDRNPTTDWDAKIWHEPDAQGDRTITVWGL